MEYIDVTWQHDDEGYPIRIISELDPDRYEIRKIELYKNGGVGYAYEEKSYLGAVLGEKPVPILEEINKDPQFIGKHINAEEFEKLWKIHASNNT